MTDLLDFMLVVNQSFYVFYTGGIVKKQCMAEKAGGDVVGGMI
jgi:hypothetical protein